MHIRHNIPSETRNVDTKDHLDALLQNNNLGPKQLHIQHTHSAHCIGLLIQPPNDHAYLLIFCEQMFPISSVQTQLRVVALLSIARLHKRKSVVLQSIAEIVYVAHLSTGNMYICASEKVAKNQHEVGLRTSFHTSATSDPPISDHLEMV